MKKFLMIIILVGVITACQNKNEYSISVSVENAPDSIMLLNNWGAATDTSLIVKGKCEFFGAIDSFPKLVSLSFPPPSRKYTRLILEPGNIQVSYSKEKGFVLGGTRNNSTFQQINEALEPFDEKVKETNKVWSNAYRKKDRNLKECEITFAKYEEAKNLKAEKQKELIKNNQNYAGFVTALPLTRDETADNLKMFLNEFKEFSSDRSYKSMKHLYECVANTTAGSKVPGFTFPNPEGNLVSLDDFRGKWLLIDFWYSGCHWCRKMTPHLINIYNDWKVEKNLEIVSISVDKPKDREKWIKAMEEDQAPWTQVWDSTKTYPLLYGVSGYPTMFLIDPEGKGTIKILGYRDEAILRELIGKQIK